MIRASVVVVSHFGHGGRERGNMALRLVSGGSVTELSVTGQIPLGAGDAPSMQSFAGASLFCFAHFGKVNKMGGGRNPLRKPKDIEAGRLWLVRWLKLSRLPDK